jgi:cysteine desulfurase/selenocysteine lyase
LDASQAVPHFKVDVTETWADAIFFTGHKLGALTWIGVLRGKIIFLKELEPSFGGGGMVDEVTKMWFTLQAAPDKFEAGTPNLVWAISMKLAIEYMEEVATSYKTQAASKIAWFYDHLVDLEQPLIAYCLEQFVELEKQWVILVGPRDTMQRIGVFSFTLPAGKNATQLGQFMAEKDICVRCGAQCAHIFHAWLDDQTWWKACIQNTCRISLRGYNDIGDVKRFFDRLRLFLHS